MALSDYSPTPSANTRISGIDISEGCNAANINDAIRQMMADLAAASLVPTGARIGFAGATAPSGWHLENGAAISRTGIGAALFAVIGTTFGNGDGSTTFNLPDTRGLVDVGVGTGFNLGDNGGEATHTLTAAESADLPISGTMAANGGHTHTITDPGHHHNSNAKQIVFGSTLTGGSGYDSPDAGNTSTSTTGITITAVGDHTHSLSGVTANGGGGAHNNMQPYLVTTKIIKL